MQLSYAYFYISSWPTTLGMFCSNLGRIEGSAHESVESEEEMGAITQRTRRGKFKKVQRVAYPLGLISQLDQVSPSDRSFCFKALHVR